jgi:hypothetical protein
VVNGAVHQADAIVTGDASRLSIALLDQSVLTVGSNASLTVDRFVFDTEADAAGVLVSLVQGAFRFVSGSRGAEPERVAFRTPTATIGIRGTIIEAAVGSEALDLLDSEGGTPVPGDDPEQTALIVLVEGEIEIEVDGQRRIVSEPGQAVAVRGRRVSEPFRLSPEAEQRLAGRLPPRESGGPGGGLEMIHRGLLDATVHQPLLVNLAWQILALHDKDAAFKPKARYEIEPVAITPKNVSEIATKGIAMPKP